MSRQQGVHNTPASPGRLPPSENLSIFAWMLPMRTSDGAAPPFFFVSAACTCFLIAALELPPRSDLQAGYRRHAQLDGARFSVFDSHHVGRSLLQGKAESLPLV